MNSRPVDFLICGTQKGGTSALDAYCRCHPDLLMPTQKELHFFDHDAAFAARDPDYDAYHGQFPAAQASKLRGESTPVYMYWPQAAQRIRAYNPDMKLIVLLRNPSERAYSHWQMESARGNEPLSFGEAIRTETARLAQTDALHKRAWSYIDRGKYIAQLEKLWSQFGRDQVLVLRSELLRESPAQVLVRVSGFLGIAPFLSLEQQTVNQQVYAWPMSDADRAYLQSVFEREITGLETLLGWDLSGWRQGTPG